MGETSQGSYDNLSEIARSKIAEIDTVSGFFPGVIIIHAVKDFSVVYMSQRGLDELNVSLEELRAQDHEDYHDTHFNPEDAKDYVPKIRELINKNTDESITFFQQVRINKEKSWAWHMSAMKVFLRDEYGIPLLMITTSLAIDVKHHITQKVSRLLEENNFLRNNYAQFSSLGRREKQILGLMALGKSSLEIAEILFISVSTVDTHRRNIKQKLNVNSSYEISQYARAFDLI